MDFKNRIVGQGDADPADLLANPKNWRVHTREQRATLAQVLESVGWVQRVIVNRRTGHLVDGHLRAELALARKESRIPVLFVDLSPEEEDLVLATIDPIAGLAKLDADRLGELLAEIEPQGGALGDLLDDLADSIEIPSEPEPEPGQEPPAAAAKPRAILILCADEKDLRRVRGALGMGKGRGKATDKAVDVDDVKVVGTLPAAEFLGALGGGE